MSILSNKLAGTISTAAVSTSQEVSRTEDEALLTRIQETADAMSETDFATMRGHYLATYGKETTLDDDAIVRIVAMSDDDKEPKEWAGDMRQMEADEATEAATVAPAISHDRLQRAHDLGAKLGNDAAFVAQAAKVGEAKQLTARAPAVIYQHLAKIWNADDWAALPVAGTKKGDAGLGENQPYDIWFVPYANDPKKKEKFSFYTEIARTVPYFRDLELQHTLHLEANKSVDKRSAEHLTKANEIASSKSRVKLKADLANFAALKSTFLNNVKKAGALHLQLLAVNRVPGVKAQIITDTQPDGTIEVQRTNAPIEISKTASPGVCETISVGSFLKIDTDKAIENAKGVADAGLGAVIATLSRDTKKTGATTDGAASKYPIVESVDDFDSCINALAHFVDDKDNVMRLREWFKKGKPEEVEQKVRDFADNYFPLEALWMGGLKQQFKKLQEADATQAEKPAKVA